MRAEWELADPFITARYWLPADGAEPALTFDRAAGASCDAGEILPRGRWAILSAENPWSIARDAGLNAAATRELESELRRRGLAARPMRSSDPAGGWAERSFLVKEIAREEVLDACRRFGQAAAVFGVHDRCGLLWVRTERWVVMRPRFVPA